MTKTSEIKDGLSGNGHQIFCVFTTVCTAGLTKIYVERFNTLAAAQNWQRWA